MISLETAKKLEEAGWSKETEKVWCELWNTDSREWFITLFDADDKVNPQIPYPSLEEILSELPESIMVRSLLDGDFAFPDFPNPDKHELSISKQKEGYGFNYSRDVYDGRYSVYFQTYHTDPAEACAQLWLKLKQEGLL